MESYWLYFVRSIPSMLCSCGNSCRNRCMYRRTSATLCHGWNAKWSPRRTRVRLRNDSSNHSSMRVSPTAVRA